MKFPPEHYFQAAAQRIRQAHFLFDEGASYALTLYVAGVAVECLLRAFKLRRDPTFDEKHDLLRLFAASGMLSVNRQWLIENGWKDEQIDAHLRDLRVAVNEIYRFWSNNYRFASEERLRSHLKEIAGYPKIKGDFLKQKTRECLNAAQIFIEKGVQLWPA